jgi:predicted acylesterase/phospholipase RssA
MELWRYPVKGVVGESLSRVEHCSPDSRSHSGCCTKPQASICSSWPLDIDDGVPRVMSHHNAPNGDVARAAVASSSIPAAMPSQPYVVARFTGADGSERALLTKLVDGGAWANYPRFVFSDPLFPGSASRARQRAGPSPDDRVRSPGIRSGRPATQASDVEGRPTIFVHAPECRRLTGFDPLSPAAVETHADAVLDLLFSRPR